MPTATAAARAVSLSNRRETVPERGKPASGARFGIDRLSVSFPVEWWNQDRTAWDSEQVRKPGTPDEAVTRSAQIKLNDETSAFVGVMRIPATGETWSKVELNPSRVVDPEGHGLCPPDDVVDVLTGAVAKVLDLVTPRVPSVREMNVKRLDVARDFEDVTRPAFIVKGLGPIARPWARRNLVHADPRLKGAQTLMVGSGAGVVRLYDKDAETGGAAPGVLRWEVEARSNWCSTYGGIDTVGDLSPENVTALANDRWEWSAMGHEVSALENVVEKVMRSGLSYTKQQRLIGYLTMLAANADVRMGKNQLTEYKRYARQLGITVGDFGSESDGFSARLDWETGREVLSV